MTEKTYTVRVKMEGGKALMSEVSAMGQTSVKSFSMMDGAMVNAGRAISRFRENIMTNVVGVLTGPALAYGIQKLIKDLASINDAAIRLGQSTDAIQEWRYLGVAVGEGAQVGEQALGNFTQRIGEAQEGLGKFKEILKDYGIALKDSAGNNRSVNDLMREYVDLIARTTDNQTQLVLATKAFGDEEGRKLIEVLRQGSDGMDRLAREAHETGNVLDKGLIEKADEFDEAWDKMLYTFTNNFKAGVVDTIASINDHIDELLLRIGAVIELMKRVPVVGGLVGDENEVNAVLQLLAYRKAPHDGLLDPMDLGDDGGLLGNGDPIGKPPPKRTSASDRDAADKIKKVIDELKERNELILQGADNQELFNKLKEAGVDIDTKAGQQIRKLVEEYEVLHDAQKKNADMARELGRAVTGAFEDAIVEGKNFSDVLKSLQQDIMRMLVKRVISDPISTAVGNIFKDFDFSKVFSFFHHDGGIAGHGTSGRMMDARLFMGAPRYHGGGVAGLRPNEVPAILERGERIIPNGRGGPVVEQKIQISIRNQTGVNAEADTRMQGDQLEITLRRSVKNMIASGDMDRVMQQRFALPVAAYGG